MPTCPDIIPERMVRNGRPADQQFDPAEMLYYRVNAQTLNVDGTSVMVQFRVERDSVNRSGHSGQPGDVLLCDHPKYADCGVIKFAVTDLPGPHVRPTQDGQSTPPPIHFGVVHDPDECNFQHSEICAFRDTIEGEEVRNIKSSTKTWFRAEMNKRITISSIVIFPRV